jgi:hypothetical protein
MSARVPDHIVPVVRRVDMQRIRELLPIARAQDARRGYAASSDPLKRGSVREATWRGLVAEQAFADALYDHTGLKAEVDTSIKPAGDGGVDFWVLALHFQIKCRCDPKWMDYLAKCEDERGRPVPIVADYHVQALWEQPRDNGDCPVTGVVKLCGWLLRAEVQSGEKMWSFCGGNFKNRVVPAAQLRPMAHLFEMLSSRKETTVHGPLAEIR